MVEMRLLGVAEVEAAFDKVLTATIAANREIVAEAAALVENTAKRNFDGAHAKGQPHVGGDKPNVVSGTLRRSIRHTTVVRDGLAGAKSTVGPTSVYARRVELGFVGTDAAGRRFNQRGYPYFRPAATATGPALLELAARRWRRAINGR